MDSLMKRKLEAYLAADAGKFEHEKTPARACYYCAGEGKHTVDCPSRSDGEEQES